MPNHLKLKPSEAKAKNESIPRTLDEKLENIKLTGNTELKNQNYDQAIRLYTQGVKLFEDYSLANPHDQNLAKSQSVYAILLSNLAQAHLNKSDFDSSILVGQKAASVDPHNVKIFFRLGKACL